MAEKKGKTKQTDEQQFAIQRIYVKDLSFESPISPNIFSSNEWKPEMNLDINTQSAVIEGDTHEVILTLTVTVKSEDKVAFIVEVKEAGLFTISHFEDEQLHHTLGSFCPSVLYPYAREVVSDIVNRGGFPQLILAPVNFEALYAQHLKQQADGGAAAAN